MIEPGIFGVLGQVMPAFLVAAPGETTRRQDLKEDCGRWQDRLSKVSLADGVVVAGPGLQGFLVGREHLATRVPAPGRGRAG